MQITLDGFHNREALDWHLEAQVINGLRQIPRGGYRAFMRKHAHQHGVAGAVRADDSFLLFYKDGGKIRQRTWKRVQVRLPK